MNKKDALQYCGASLFVLIQKEEADSHCRKPAPQMAKRKRTYYTKSVISPWGEEGIIISDHL